MENQKRYNLTISGIGSSGGGIFADVSIDGIGKISGDLDCMDFNINGVGNVEGSVKTETGKINGKGGIAGTLQAEEFTVNGHFKIGGNTNVKNARLEGVVGIRESMAAETVENRGVLTVDGDLNSEVFMSKGVFTIGGLLNAGNIEVDLYAPCKAKEIGGEKIVINRGHSMSLRKLIKSIIPVFDINTGLDTETIEGDEIYLEDTQAKVVRGNNVLIGKGCKIELVEYKGRFEKSEKAVVLEHRKLD